MTARCHHETPTEGKVEPAKQLSSNTHFLDGSQIYGSDDKSSNDLRTMVDGFLKTSNVNDVNCFPSHRNVKIVSITNWQFVSKQVTAEWKRIRSSPPSICFSW
uniref:Uncharacterized protein n=1 Tax=Daphnia galeata TaxID=27404 RepID=A0A8J2RD69_9CRUS|nr:unnamed protein product [Daphnia galeata]